MFRHIYSIFLRIYSIFLCSDIFLFKHFYSNCFCSNIFIWTFFVQTLFFEFFSVRTFFRTFSPSHPSEKTHFHLTLSAAPISNPITIENFRKAVISRYSLLFFVYFKAHIFNLFWFTEPFLEKKNFTAN